MKIHRDINGIRVSFDLTDDEIVEWVSAKSIDERVVFFRKLAQLDLKSFDIFNFLKTDKK